MPFDFKHLQKMICGSMGTLVCNCKFPLTKHVKFNSRKADAHARKKNL